MLNTITGLVKDTKRIIMDLDLQHNVNEKGHGNYVTKVDFAVQSYLKEQLFRLFPSYYFLGEEDADVDVDFAKETWILDPIDGTANLVHNLNQSAVSLALVKNEVPLLGVVYNPFTEELYYAERGKGASFNGKPISVSSTETVYHSLLGFGTAPYDKNLASQSFGIALDLYKNCEDLRRSGAAAIDLCHLASGKIDGFFEYHLKPWDYAAGAIILEEAGGKITDFYLNPVTFRKPCDILATNGKIHEEMHKHIKKHL